MAQTYVPLSRFPGTERDICFQVKQDIAYDAILQAIGAARSELSYQTTVSPVDIYQADNSKTKNVTVRIGITSTEKTLTSEEVASAVDAIVQKVSKTTGAQVV